MQFCCRVIDLSQDLAYFMLAGIVHLMQTFSLRMGVFSICKMRCVNCPWISWTALGSHVRTSGGLEHMYFPICWECLIIPSDQLISLKKKKRKHQPVHFNGIVHDKIIQLLGLSPILGLPVNPHIRYGADGPLRPSYGRRSTTSTARRPCRRTGWAPGWPQGSHQKLESQPDVMNAMVIYGELIDKVI